MVALLLLLAKQRADQGGSSRPKQQEQRALVVVLHCTQVGRKVLNSCQSLHENEVKLGGGGNGSLIYPLVRARTAWLIGQTWSRVRSLVQQGNQWQ
jgi:hypothetical protein